MRPGEWNERLVEAAKASPWGVLLGVLVAAGMLLEGWL